MHTWPDRRCDSLAQCKWREAAGANGEHALRLTGKKIGPLLRGQRPRVKGVNLGPSLWTVTTHIWWATRSNRHTRNFKDDGGRRDTLRGALHVGPARLCCFYARHSRLLRPIGLAAICSGLTISNISYSSAMDWGQVSIFFAVACFAAIVFFMIRKPQA